MVGRFERIQKIIALAAFCLLLAARAAPESRMAAGAADAFGDFELNPTAPNNCWASEDSYDYNQYEIEITSSPKSAKIEFGQEQIGATPMVYAFTGTIHNDDYLVVRAVPFDRSADAKEKIFKGTMPLPRKIHFNMQK